MFSADDFYDRVEQGQDVRLWHVAKAYRIYQNKLKENNCIKITKEVVL